MNDHVLEGALADLREREIRLLHEVGDALAGLSPEGEADRQRLREVADDLRYMFFMVVVVGEFNAGKSSFINALLEDNLLPTGITPTTEVIELIRYAEAVSRRSVLRDDGVREWTHPGLGGAGVVLVDTPGTGSVFRQHEEIARNFLHRSDLVVFVMSAKRALGETDRLYLELIRDFGKKIVVVINQTDLLEPREQADVRRFVQSQLETRLGLKPLIFMVSAKRALAGEGDSGLEAVRAHLRATFEQVPPARQKLGAQLDLAQRQMAKHHERLETRLDLIGRNRDQTAQIELELETHAAAMDAQLAAGTAQIGRLLGEVRQRGMRFIDANFKVRMPGQPSNDEALRGEFEEHVIGRALDQINDISNDYVNALVDSNRRYWQNIVRRLSQLDDILQQDVRGVDGGVYSEQRQALQEAIAIADVEMGAYSNTQMLNVMQERFKTNVTGLGTSLGVGLGGLIAALLGIATPGALTVFPLAMIGFVGGVAFALGGGGFALSYWRRLRQDVKRDFNGQMDIFERGYGQAMAELTERERSRLLQYGHQILDPVFSRFEVIAQAAERDVQILDGLSAQLEALRREIETVPEPTQAE